MVVYPILSSYFDHQIAPKNYYKQIATSIQILKKQLCIVFKIVQQFFNLSVDYYNK